MPFATIGLQIGTSTEAMVVLATVDGDLLTWVAADHSVIQTRNGRIVRFQSGDVDVETAPTAPGDDPVAEGRIGGGPVTRLLDFPKAKLYSVPAQSTIAAAGEARVGLLHGEVLTRAFTETGISHPLGWNFENHFYLDLDTKRVWQSNQTVTPQLPPIKIRVLRPYAGDIA